MPPTFEVLFTIPDHHRLVLVRSRACGGVLQGTYWTHEEVDPSGFVVAQYDTGSGRWIRLRIPGLLSNV